jgi:hypothetical protein
MLHLINYNLIKFLLELRSQLRNPKTNFLTVNNWSIIVVNKRKIVK